MIFDVVKKAENVIYYLVDISLETFWYFLNRLSSLKKPLVRSKTKQFKL